MKYYKLYEGVKHAKLGLGIVINEPDPAGFIIVEFQNGDRINTHPSGLEPWPTDLNGKLIEVGQDILFHSTSGRPHFICQGIVETIKWGQQRQWPRQKVLRVGIREDITGRIRSIDYPKECIVIDKPVIKQEK